MLQSTTKTVALGADRDEVFDFLSQPENLPKWATVFCSAIRADGDRWIASTADGEIPIEYAADKPTGTIDMTSEVARGVTLAVHSRVVPSYGGCAYTFTIHQLPGQPDDEFHAQCTGLAEEFRGLEARFGVLAAPPTRATS